MISDDKNGKTPPEGKLAEHDHRYCHPDEAMAQVLEDRDALDLALKTEWELHEATKIERDRLISTNDTLVSRIEDLSQGYGLEDTCPRVQCRTASRRLKAQCEQMRRAVEYALQGFSTEADAPFLALFRNRYRKAMER